MSITRAVMLAIRLVVIVVRIVLVVRLMFVGTARIVVTAGIIVAVVIVVGVVVVVGRCLGLSTGAPNALHLRMWDEVRRQDIRQSALLWTG